jgi:uroporphyrinogen decarboxylase
LTGKRERLKAALAGDVADRPPVALWRHFPVDDQSSEMLAEAVVAFQREYDFDFIKVTPASSYCVRDWGVTDEWQGSTEGTRSYVRRRVTRPQDWRNLELLDPRAGARGEHLRCLRSIVQAAGDSAPVLATVFSPLAQAKNLAGQDVLFEHIRTDPETVLAGLDRITASTIQLVEAMRETAIEGIFYAIQHASSDFFDMDGYRRFGLAFDRPVLQAADLWLDVIHLHGDRLLFDIARELAAPVVNWHDREGGPGLREGRGRSEKAVCGGLAREDTLVLGDPARVRSEAELAMGQTDGGRGLILGTGCVVPIHAPRANLLAARRAVELPGSS